MKFKLILIAALFVSCAAFAQRDSSHRLRLIVGGGYGFRLNKVDAPTADVDISTSSPGGTLRLMWKPEHLLSVGIESGYLPITQATAKGNIKPDEADGNANLTAIPALLIFSMEKYGVELSAGLGMYSLRVRGKSNKGSLENSAVEIGYTFSGAYTLELSNSLGIGAEVKYYAFTDRDIVMLFPQLRLEWTVFAY